MLSIIFYGNLAGFCNSSHHVLKGGGPAEAGSQALVEDHHPGVHEGQAALPEGPEVHIHAQARPHPGTLAGHDAGGVGILHQDGRDQIMLGLSVRKIEFKLMCMCMPNCGIINVL